MFFETVQGCRGVGVIKTANIDHNTAATSPFTLNVFINLSLGTLLSPPSLGIGPPKNHFPALGIFRVDFDSAHPYSLTLGCPFGHSHFLLANLVECSTLNSTLNAVTFTIYYHLWQILGHFLCIYP